MAAGDLLPTGEAMRPCDRCQSEDVVPITEAVPTWQQTAEKKLITIGVRCRACRWEYRIG